MGIAMAILLPSVVAAQPASSSAPAGQTPAGAPSASELAKQTQNPIASLISLPLEANWDMGVGQRDATSVLLNVQPVIPFAITESTNLVLRVIMPLVSRPSSESDGDRVNGLGDVLFSAFLAPSDVGDVIWGLGPVLLLPTATDAELGSEHFGIGPTAVVLVQPASWTFGLLANQVWSVSGADDRDDVDRTYLQPFMHYNLGGGLSLGASGEITADWEAADHTWSGPLLFSISKVAMLGAQAVNFKLAAGPTFGPDEGPDWRFRFAANFLFPR